VTYRELIEVMVEVIEVLGTAAIIVGGLIAGVRAVVGLVRGADLVYARLRRELGHTHCSASRSSSRPTSS
jgi:uncharacterized membrane protein